MLSTFFQPCEIKVNFIQNVVFLRPPQNPTGDHDHRTHELPPLSNDELVRGIIHLYVPVRALLTQSPRHIDGIRVQLRVSQSIAVLDASFNYVPTTWENSTLMERTLEIGVPMRLSKLNPYREASQSVSRARSPAMHYGGGGRHSDHARGEHSRYEHRYSDGVGVLKNMVRGVSRGRAPFRGDHSPVSPESPRPQSRGRNGWLHSDSTVDHSRNRSPVPHERDSALGSDFVHSPLRPEPGSTPFTEEDFNRINLALEEHGSRELRRRMSGYEVTTRDHERSRSHSTHRSEYGTRPASLTRTQSPEDEMRGRSKTKASEIVVRDQNENGMELSKGVHAFEFAFIIPADSPPYDRSPFGKIKYAVKVTALGAGRAKSNVEEWKDFFPMVNPAPDGGMTPMTVLYNDIHATVGILSVACTSNNISVGGLFNIDIHSPSPPADLIVYMVRVSLHTTIELHTKRKGKQYVPVQKRKLFERGHVAPQDQAMGDNADRLPGYVRYAGTDHAWTVQGVARIPDDNAIRPSTIPGTRSALRFHHVLVVEVVHSRDCPGVKDCLTADGKRKLKVFTLRQNIIIPSCCCALDAVTLPPYSASENDDTNVPQIKHGLSGWDQIVRANQDRGESHNMCVCGMSLADLSAAEQAMLPPPDPSELLLDRVRHNGKIGELPTPDEAGLEGEGASGSYMPGAPSAMAHAGRASWAPPPHMSPRTELAVPALSSPRQLGSGHTSGIASPLVLTPTQDLPPAYSQNE
ncbi:hypothetical protein MOBT1_001481 [Malassezia obtusa]|uniref:Arrestin-like N-terminal domain-containing protein n=1 Tax=Malassezia obtusa TaxID=76774 RepID=A0AAF0IW96_9BASI|nr:hypothetical protein MOBT1_001481 [Malassezia obtusa]